MKNGSLWFCAAGACGLATLAGSILIWGAAPLMPGAGAPTNSRFYWDLPLWLGLASLAAMLLGIPCATMCAAIGARHRTGSQAVLWITGALLWVTHLSWAF